MDQEKELGQDFSLGSLFKFVAPSIFTFVFIAAYQMVDGIFIERFVGDMAISATNLFYPLLGLFVATGIMLGTGGNAMIVKLVGEGKHVEAGRVFSELLLFTVALGVIVTAVCLVFADPIMGLCGATAGNVEYLRPYYMVMCAFSIAIVLQSLLGILIIGEGKTVVAAVVIMVGGVLNCVLDYVFMKHLKMGIRGAAIATVIGYCSTIVYAVWYYLIAKKSTYTIELTRINLGEIGRICFNGSSDMASNLAGGVTALFMNHLAYRCYGEAGVSALSVWSYMQFLIIAVFMGFTSAVEPVFSYHYGSGNVAMRKKVYRLSVIWSVALGGICLVLMFLFRNQLIGIFFERDTVFFEIASTGLLISLPACLFVGVNNFASGMFTAFGNGAVSFALSMIRTFAVLTACLYGLTALFGGPGLWSAWPAAEVLSLFVTLWFLKKYRNRYQYR